MSKDAREPMRCPHCKKKVGPHLTVAVMDEFEECYHCGGTFKISKLGERVWTETVEAHT